MLSTLYDTTTNNPTVTGGQTMSELVNTVAEKIGFRVQQKDQNETRLAVVQMLMAGVLTSVFTNQLTFDTVAKVSAWSESGRLTYLLDTKQQTTVVVTVDVCQQLNNCSQINQTVDTFQAIQGQCQNVQFEVFRAKAFVHMQTCKISPQQRGDILPANQFEQLNEVKSRLVGDIAKEHVAIYKQLYEKSVASQKYVELVYMAAVLRSLNHNSKITYNSAQVPIVTIEQYVDQERGVVTTKISPGLVILTSDNKTPLQASLERHRRFTRKLPFNEVVGVLKRQKRDGGAGPKCSLIEENDFEKLEELYKNEFEGKIGKSLKDSKFGAKGVVSRRHAEKIVDEDILRDREGKFITEPALQGLRPMNEEEKKAAMEEAKRLESENERNIQGGEHPIGQQGTEVDENGERENEEDHEGGEGGHGEGGEHGKSVIPPKYGKGAKGKKPNVQDYEVMPHETMSSKLGGHLMNMLMYLDLVGAMSDHSMKRTVMAAAWIGGPKAIGTLMQWSKQFFATALKTSLLFNKMFRVTRCVFGRFALPFMIMSVVHDIMAVARGEKHTVVPLLVDVTAVAIDMYSMYVEISAQIELAVAEVAEEGLVAVTEAQPELILITAALFCLSRAYRAYWAVQGLNDTIQLTDKEYTVEYWRRFVGRENKNFIEYQAQQKTTEEHLLENIRASVKQRPEVKYFTMSDINVRDGKEEDQPQPVADNIIDFQGAEVIRYNKGFPTIQAGEELLCSFHFKHQLPQCNTTDCERKMYNCKGMIGLNFANVRDMTKAVAHIDAADGDDIIKGFLDVTNEIHLAGGFKYAASGKKPDTFYLYGNEALSGMIDGKDGDDTINMYQYLLTEPLIRLTQLASNVMTIKLNRPVDDFIMKSFSIIVGRPDLTEEVEVTCDHLEISLMGGQSGESMDLVDIKSRSCRYNVVVDVYKNTHVKNQAASGQVAYRFFDSKDGQSIVESNQDSTATSSSYRFMYELEHIAEIKYAKNVLEIKSKNGSLVKITNYNPRDPIVLGGSSSLLIQDNDRIIFLNNEPTLEAALKRAQLLSKTLQAYVFANEKKTNVHVHVGHDAVSANNTNTHSNMMTNNASETTYMYGATENTFTITHKLDAAGQPAFAGVTIELAKKGSNTIDLHVMSLALKDDNFVDMTYETNFDNPRELVITVKARPSNGQYQLTVGRVIVKRSNLGASLMIKQDSILELKTVNGRLQWAKQFIDTIEQVTYMLDVTEAKEKGLIRQKDGKKLQFVTFKKYILNSLHMIICQRTVLDNKCDNIVMLRYFDDKQDVFNNFKLDYSSQVSTVKQEYTKFLQTHSHTV